MSTTASELANAARCYNCEIPSGEQLAVAIYLLNLIATSGITAMAIVGEGSPEGVVVGYEGMFYWDKLNHQLYVKNSGQGTNTGWFNY